MDFAKSASFKSYGEKKTVFAALALSTLRRIRVQSMLPACIEPMPSTFVLLYYQYHCMHIKK